jgi:hypothetical protein
MNKSQEQIAATQRIHEALQAAADLWPWNEEVNSGGQEMITEWTVICSVEGVEKEMTDEEGEPMAAYFYASSEGISRHAIRGLLEKAIDRQRGL